MASNSVNNEKTELDPMFYVPEGYVGFTDNNSNAHNDDDSENVDDFSDVYVQDEDFNTVLPATPDVLALVDQTMQVGAAGEVTVDVEIEVEDLPGEYEFRVSVL